MSRYSLRTHQGKQMKISLLTLLGSDYMVFGGWRREGERQKQRKDRLNAKDDRMRVKVGVEILLCFED